MAAVCSDPDFPQSGSTWRCLDRSGRYVFLGDQCFCAVSISVSGGRWQGAGICDPGHVSRHAAVWQAVQPGCGEGWNLSASEIVWRCKEFFSGNYETCQNYGEPRW